MTDDNPNSVTPAEYADALATAWGMIAARLTGDAAGEVALARNTQHGLALLHAVLDVATLTVDALADATGREGVDIATAAMDALVRHR